LNHGQAHRVTSNAPLSIVVYLPADEARKAEERGHAKSEVADDREYLTNPGIALEIGTEMRFDNISVWRPFVRADAAPQKSFHQHRSHALRIVWPLAFVQKASFR
jgi:hypothetical protein